MPELSTPDEVRRIARAYLARTGMAPADFARRVGYHYSTINQFLVNRYRRGPGSREEAICEAILNFVGTRQEPPDEFHGKLFEIGNMRVMRQIFDRLCASPCILLCYAPPGSGKTEVARGLICQFRSADIEVRRIYCRAAITRRDLMRRVAIACGSIADISIERTIANLRYDYAGHRMVLYFDEAQHLSVECLETVRELYDELHWSLCFAGSHLLDKIFTKWAGDLEQLERRVTDKVSLPAVTMEEAEGIIRSELPALSAAKIRAVIEQSHVQIRGDAGLEHYLSIGRVMATVRELQNLAIEKAEPMRKVEAIK
jgi:DNA transposition AAA+ family ATPase